MLQPYLVDEANIGKMDATAFRATPTSSLTGSVMGTPRTSRPCYVCGKVGNSIIAEEPCERRFGRPFMPEGRYRLARCGTCGTLYADSDVTDGYLHDLYALETETSVLEAVPGLERTEHIAVRLPEFQGHWGRMRARRLPRDGDRLLDMGCQTGEFGAVAAEDGVTPYGTELSAEYAGTCCRRWGRGSTVHVGHLATAPFSPGEFQYITAFETLEHVCDPIEELRQLRVWLADDGLLAISVPSSNYFRLKYWLLASQPLAGTVRRFAARRSSFYKRQILIHSHIYSFTPTAVRAMLTQAGFEPLAMENTGWHANSPRLATWIVRGLTVVTRGRIAIAPSVFALARKPKKE